MSSYMEEEELGVKTLQIFGLIILAPTPTNNLNNIYILLFNSRGYIYQYTLQVHLIRSFFSITSALNILPLDISVNHSIFPGQRASGLHVNPYFLCPISFLLIHHLPSFRSLTKYNKINIHSFNSSYKKYSTRTHIRIYIIKASQQLLALQLAYVEIYNLLLEYFPFCTHVQYHKLNMTFCATNSKHS